MAPTFFVLFLARIPQRSFGTCLKKYQPFSWEASWVLFPFIGVLCVPHIWYMVEIPHYLNYTAATPVPTLIVGALPSFFWGISPIWYSKATDMVGVLLVAGINLGLSNLLGSFVPMIILGTYPPARAPAIFLSGQLISLGDVIILSKVGFMKDRNNGDTRTAKEKGTSSLFITGLTIALTSGTGSAAINIGTTVANYPVVLAMKEGVNLTSVSLLFWAAVFMGGFLVNFVYAISKLVKNKTYTNYTKPDYAKAYFKAMPTPIVWFNTLAIYDKATVLLGILGSMMGWATFNRLALIIASAQGFLDGEWKGFEEIKCMAIYGNAVIIAALVVADISSGLQEGINSKYLRLRRPSACPGVPLEEREA